MRCVSLFVGLVVVSLLASCSVPTTQIVFVVSARGAALAGASELVVQVRGPDGIVEGLPRVALREGGRSERVLAQVPVVPIDGDDTRLLDFDALLLDARGAVLAQTTLYNVAFVRDQLREVPVLVVSACEGQADGSACALECHACSAEICVPSADGAPCGCDGDACGAGVCNPSVTVRDVQASSAFVSDGVFSDHTCALAYGGAVSCWGSNRTRSLGVVGGEGGVPTLVVASTSNTGLAGSAAAHCTISTTMPMCWGNNQFGMVAPTGGSVLGPTPRSMPPGVVVAMSGSSAMYAIDADQALWAWGRNTQGEVGIVSADPEAVRTPSRAAGPLEGARFMAVDGRSVHACAIRVLGTERRGELWCWGWNGSREVAPTDETMRFEPACVDVPGEAPCPADWIEVSVGNFHTCAIRADQSLWCWGGSASGQLGLGPEVLPVPNIGTPRRLPGRWRSVSAGQRATCAIDVDGQLRCWGLAQVRTADADLAVTGLLGDGRFTLSSSVPLAVLPPTRDTTWRSVSLAARHACAVRASDQTLWCWGDNREHAVDASAEVAIGQPRRVCPTTRSAP